MIFQPMFRLSDRVSGVDLMEDRGVGWNPTFRSARCVHRVCQVIPSPSVGSVGLSV